MAANWLTTVAWLYLCICIVCSAAITYDIAFNRRRQSMRVMNVVYPVTALYLGPIALVFYWRWGRAPTQPSAAHAKAAWVGMAMEVSHCGSGCVLGDLIAEWTIFWAALTIAGHGLPAEYLGDYSLALAFGVVFQYFAIAPMRGLGLKDGLRAAAKADFISLTFFEIGLFGWMALMAFVLFPGPHRLMPTSVAYWFLMQIGMILGFVTAWPANVWLVNRGIKASM